MCSAADVISALGARVEVHAPAAAWPRGAGRLVVSNRAGWLGDLALVTAVPGTPVVDVSITAPAARLLRRAGAVFVEPGVPGVVAEVTRRLRGGGTVLVHPEGTTSGGPQLDRFRPALFEAAVDASAPVCPVAVRHRTERGTVVVEIHLLPALDPAGADRRTLAALAEYAVAEVVETGAPAAVRPRAVGPTTTPDRPVTA